MKHLSIFVGLGFLLSGCVTQNNLLTNKGQMDDATFEIVERLAFRASEGCVTVRRTSGPASREVGGRMKIHTDIVVNNLYISDSTWYRAEIIANRAWFNVYFNDLTDRISCGDKHWAESGNAGTIVFKRYEAGAVR